MESARERFLVTAPKLLQLLCPYSAALRCGVVNHFDGNIPATYMATSNNTAIIFHYHNYCRT
jgi:hypothetical protein